MSEMMRVMPLLTQRTTRDASARGERKFQEPVTARPARKLQTRKSKPSEFQPGSKVQKSIRRPKQAIFQACGFGFWILGFEVSAATAVDSGLDELPPPFPRREFCRRDEACAVGAVDPRDAAQGEGICLPRHARR